MAAVSAIGSSDLRERCRASIRGGTPPTACRWRTRARRCRAGWPRSSASRCRTRPLLEPRFAERRADQRVTDVVHRSDLLRFAEDLRFEHQHARARRHASGGSPALRHVCATNVSRVPPVLDRPPAAAAARGGRPARQSARGGRPRSRRSTCTSRSGVSTEISIVDRRPARRAGRARSADRSPNRRRQMRDGVTERRVRLEPPEAAAQLAAAMNGDERAARPVERACRDRAPGAGSPAHARLERRRASAGAAADRADVNPADPTANTDYRRIATDHSPDSRRHVADDRRLVAGHVARIGVPEHRARRRAELRGGVAAPTPSARRRTRAAARARARPSGRRGRAPRRAAARRRRGAPRSRRPRSARGRCSPRAARRPASAHVRRDGARERIAQRHRRLARLIPHHERHDRHARQQARDERQLHLERVLPPVRRADARRSRRDSAAIAAARSSATATGPSGVSHAPARPDRHALESRRNATARPARRPRSGIAAPARRRTPPPGRSTRQPGMRRDDRARAARRPASGRRRRCASTSRASASRVPGYQCPATADGLTSLIVRSADCKLTDLVVMRQSATARHHRCPM